MFVEFDEQLRKLLPEQAVDERFRFARLRFAEFHATVVGKDPESVGRHVEYARRHCEGRDQSRSPSSLTRERTLVGGFQEPKDPLERHLEERVVVLDEIWVPPQDEHEAAIDLRLVLLIRSRLGEREESIDEVDEPGRLVGREDSETGVDGESEGEGISIVLAEVDEASCEGADKPAKSVELSARKAAA